MKNLSLRQQVSLYIGSLMITTGLILFLLYQLDSVLKDFIFRSFILLSILFILFPFIKINSKWIACYFFCFDKDWWDKRIQRPRIFIYIIYFIFLLMLLGSNNSNVNQYIKIANNFILVFYVLIGIVFLGKMVWTEKFETTMLPQIKNILTNDITIRKMSTEEISEIIEVNHKNIEDSSADDLKLFLEGNEIKNKIKWIGTSGKKVVTYTDLFSLLHNIIDGADCKFERSRRKEFLNLIINNFEKFENLESKEITYNNLNSAYTNFVL